MKKAIIHISDLHITSHIDSDGEKLSNFDSWLNTNPDDKISNSYIDSFIDIIRNKYQENKLYLIVTGDITEKGSMNEFDISLKILNKICTDLSINKKDVLIVPGDHDVSWIDCINAYEKSDKSKLAYLLNEQKFINFKNFYDIFFQTDFNPNNQIVNYLDIEDEKILILGLNSNYKVGTKPADGFIDGEKLEMELAGILPKYTNYSKIAAFHHNFIANYEMSYKGQWEKINLQDITRLLNKNEFKIVLYGNEHTPFSDDKKQLFQSAVGSFGKKIPHPSFKVYLIKNNAGLSLIPECINTINQNNLNDYPFGYWTKIPDTPNEVSELVLVEPAKEINAEAINLSHLPETPCNVPERNIDYITKSIKDRLFNVIKNKKLFYSGHFHWSETSRAHNWIDVTKILNNRDDIVLANDAIVDIISQNGIISLVDFIIGLGIEGNILASNLLLYHNKPYSYLPYSYRYDEHNNYEKKLNFENDGKYKNILIVTDVVNEGRTLRKLIDKREKEFFKDVEKIYVVSLFYTGQCEPISVKILNTNQENCDKINDHIEDRIEYYFALNLRVEKCPYGENFREKCMIYKNDLGTVHLFYDDENALLKRNAELIISDEKLKNE